MFAWSNSDYANIVVQAIKAIENENEESKHELKKKDVKKMYKGFQIDQFNTYLHSPTNVNELSILENNMIKK